MARQVLDISFRLGNDARAVTLGVGLLILAIADFTLPGTQPAIIAISTFIFLATVLVLCAARFRALKPFGAANAITTFRVGLMALLIGAAADASEALATWWPAVLSGLALALDGLDGEVARRCRMESRFGAYFDQETDALLILALVLLLAISGKVGPWIVVAGLMRYGLLTAGWILPSLAAPLPKSRFRSGTCAIMVAALVVCLLPILASSQASIIAAIALTALTLSFGKDLIWLLKNTRGRKHA